MTIGLELGCKASQKQLTYIADRVLSSKRLVFVSGAGISCSAGIPDFRSLHGLYNSQEGCNIRGQDLFDASLFKSAQTTALFYKFMAELREKTLAAVPTPTHRLLKLFKDRGSLLRSYTQNIDGLEDRAGLNLNPLPIKSDDVVQLHGDIHTLKCSLCSQTYAWEKEYIVKLKAGEAVECLACADKCAMRMALGRRAVASGTLRPDIVLYGEEHPAGDRIARACEADLKRKPDCLVIAGTSLKIPGLKRLVKDFAKAVHAVGGLVLFVNLTDVGTKEWTNVIDYHISGTSDGFVDLLRATRPAFFTKQVTLKSCKNTKFVGEKKLSTTKKSTGALCEAESKGNMVVLPCHSYNDFKDKVRNLLSDNKENIAPTKRKIAPVDYAESGKRTRVKLTHVSEIKVEN